MKKQFSRYWNSSKQPRKQRKFRATAPKHIKQKMLASHLSHELRKRYSRRSFQIRKGDNVKIMSGENKGKSGKIEVVDTKRGRVAIEGIQRTKKEGSKVNLFFNPSKLIILELNLDDKKRLNSIKKEDKTLENKFEVKK